MATTLNVLAWLTLVVSVADLSMHYLQKLIDFHEKTNIYTLKLKRHTWAASETDIVITQVCLVCIVQPSAMEERFRFRS